MVVITLPNGSTKEFKAGASVLEIAQGIGPRLALAAIAGKVDGKMVDLSFKVEADAKIQILTWDSPEGKEVFRHSTSHLLAMAVKELYPDVLLAIGPSIEDGFYYDFDAVPFKPECLEKIEAKMNELAGKDLLFERSEVSKKEAEKIFKEKGETYKLELLSEIKDKNVSLYKCGDFLDLCLGPHVSSTGRLKSFKLLRVAGAYWKGDEKNKMLQRIYGVSFPEKKLLDEHLAVMEDALKRDHRKLGKELDLFVFSDLVGPGLPLWTPKGATIRRELERFILDEELARGYLHVCTPELAKVDLYKKSGHYPYYKESMYPIMKVDNEELILRPMTCPHHFELYSSKKRSYKELPMRIAELARLYRYEKSGELTGLIRVRSFCLADAHIICRKEQAFSEINGALDLIEYVCSVLKIEKGKGYSYRLSLGDRADTKKYYKNDALWDEGEEILRKVIKGRDVPFVEAAGEAAFYGPKIDVQMRNVSGKEDTAFTVQYDFCMPDRFNLTFVNEKNEDEKAVVVHRSSIGAIERIVGFLIEKYAGHFPLWLSPVQVAIMPLSDEQNKFAKSFAEELKKEKVRVFLDDRNDKVDSKIRDAQLQKIPLMLVIGKREVESGVLAVRTWDGKIENVKIEAFKAKLLKDIAERV